MTCRPSRNEWVRPDKHYSKVRIDAILGKSREISVRPDVEDCILADVEAAGIIGNGNAKPVFLAEINGMAGPTDVLTEDVKGLRAANRELASDLRESNRQLSDEIKRVFERSSAELRDSNQRLTDAINRVAGDFGSFRVELVKELGEIKSILKKELGTINTSLGKYQGETATSLKHLGRGITILTPIVAGLVVALVGAAIGFTWKAAKLDSRVEYVELQIHKGSSPIPTSDKRVSPVPPAHGSSDIDAPPGLEPIPLNQP